MKPFTKSFIYHSNIKANLIGSLLALLSVASAFTQEFRGLGLLPGTTSARPIAISADGTVVVGPRATLEGSRLWRWTASGGLSDVSDVAIHNVTASLQVVLSADGSTIAGAVVDSGELEAFRWSEKTGLLRLGVLPDAIGSVVWKMSRDGSVIVGLSGDIPGRGFVAARPWRWTQQSGMQEILVPSQMDQGNLNFLVGLSSDGNTVAGQNGAGQIWRWTKSNGLEERGPDLYSSTVSSDGRTIVGAGSFSSAWRWTSEVFETIGKPAGYDSGQALFVSANGNSIVGASLVDPQISGDHVWRWENGNFTMLPVTENTRSMAPLFTSSDASVVFGFSSLISGEEISGGEYWRWSQDDGLMVFNPPIGSLGVNLTGISVDGSIVLGRASYINPSNPGQSISYPWLWTKESGMRTVADDFPEAQLWNSHGYLAISEDGSTILGAGINPNGNEEPWIARRTPAILEMTPASGAANGAGFTIEIAGAGVAAGSRIFWNGTELITTEEPSKLVASVPSSLLEMVNPPDVTSVAITIVGPTGATSKPRNFMIVRDQSLQEKITAIESVVATPSVAASVSILPETETSSGISATLTLSGDEPASVTLATYGSDPSGSANTSFEVAGQFLDLNASGVTEADTLTAYFYFPAGTDTENLALKFWKVNSTPAAWDNVTPISIDAALNRIEVIFNATSHPKITELDGTFFAAAHELPIQFTGFLAPIGGADATGGSFAAPMRTFKAGSTIPVKFRAAGGGVPVTTGIHRLQTIKYSDATTAGTPIDATPQEAATTGNQFHLSGQEWHFNLDTKRTGVSTGIWQLVATLSDGSQHAVWVQMK